MATQVHAAGPTGQRSPGLEAAIAAYIAENGVGGASPAEIDASVQAYLTLNPPAGPLTPTDRPVMPPVTMIQRFAAGHGWIISAGGTGTVADSTEQAAFGSQSVKFVPAGGTSKSLRQIGFTLDLTAAELVIWVRLIGAAQAINIYAGNTALSSYFRWTLALDAAGWLCLVLPWSKASVTGTPNRALIEQLRVETQVGDGIYLGGIGYQAISATYPNGVVSITFDDSLVDAFTKARPSMDAYGYRGTGYLLASTVGQPGGLTLQQLHQFEDVNGWEISGHGFGQHTNLTTLSADAVDAELSGLKTYLHTNRFRGEDHFAWPYGGNNATVREIAARYFTSARALGGNNQSSSATPRLSGAMRLPSHALGSPGVATLADLKAIVDRAKATRSWETFLFHNITSGATSGDVLGQADLDALLAHINTQGVAVAPVGEVVRGAP